MSPLTLYRLSGLALIISAPLALVGRILHPPNHGLDYQTSPAWLPAHGLLVLSFWLTLVGLPGLYARLAGRAGTLGLAAFLLCWMSVTGALINQYHEALVTPILATSPAGSSLSAEGASLQYAPFGALGAVRGPLTVLGYLLFGWVAWRAGLGPRWGAALLIVGGLIYLASGLGEIVFHVAGVVIQLGWAGLALGLWSTRADPG